MSKATKSLLLILVLSLFISNANSQTGLNSPYSGFGPGYISEVNSVKNWSLGGLAIGMQDPFTINVKNPASYIAIDTTSFMFEAGFSGHYMNLKGDDVSQQHTTGSLSHLLFGFPVTNWWRSSIGLLPYSAIGYSIVNSEFEEGIGQVKHLYEGDGGISRFFIGNSFRPIKNISIGVNVSYLFGSIERKQNISFPDSLNMLGTLINNTISVSDFYFDFGLQYKAQLNNKTRIIIGGIYSPKLNLTAKKNYLARTYLGEINQIQVIRDTIAEVVDEKGVVVIPSGYGFGFSIEREGNWLVGADFKMQNWKDFESFNVRDSLKNSLTLAVGGQYTPDMFNAYSYFKRIDYRLGAKYTKTNLNIRDIDINEVGMTFGFGFPVKRTALHRSVAKINLGFEVGRRGTLENNLIQENYVKMFFGVTIYQTWFMKRRYD
jgi:hypothetical protein